MKNMNTNKYSSGGGDHFTKIKGFTLIELLAVIIILGVLMIIAIPSVSSYITNARKNAYITTIKGYQSGISQKVNNLEYSFLDIDTTYYVHIDNIKLEKGGKSPFGEWLDAYVVVTYNGNGYDYYWTSVDESGHKVILKDIEDITIDDIITDSEKKISNKRAIDNKSKIVIIDKNGNSIEETPSLEYTKEEASLCYKYSIDNGKVSILSYDDTCSKNVKIPDTISDYPITNIKAYAFFKKEILSIEFPDSLEEISEYAFQDNKLEKLEFPSGLKKIGAGAFANNLLTELPDLSMVETLGGGAFSNNKFDDSEAFIYAKNDDGTYDYSKIIGYAGTEKNLVIPSIKEGVTLKVIGAEAFRWIQLDSVVIPEGVETIESVAFSGCNLSSVELPSTLKYIGQTAFTSNKLTNIEIPENVTYIGSRSFNNNQLEDEDAFIYKRNSDGSIDYSTIVSYGGKNRDNIIIPEEKNGVVLKKISSWTFFGIGLTSVTIPNTVVEIGAWAFNANNLPDEDAFIYKRTEEGIDYSTIIGYGGEKRENVIVPNEKNGVLLTTIDSYAFSDSAIKNISLPEGLLTIKNDAFDACKLTEVTIPSTVTTIGNSAFRKTSSNENLVKIINKTGKSFDWRSITAGNYEANFVTGTIRHQYGNITVVDN